MEKQEITKVVKEILKEIRDVNIQQTSASNSTLLAMVNSIKEDLKKLYSPKEIDLMFGEVKEHLINQDKSLLQILEQTTRHNGRMYKLEKYLLIIGCVTGTIVVLKFPDVIKAIKLFI